MPVRHLSSWYSLLQPFNDVASLQDSHQRVNGNRDEEVQQPVAVEGGVSKYVHCCQVKSSNSYAYRLFYHCALLRWVVFR
jgi:hypothetical protein